jgi:Pyruvate/2-oxoacid:ferredoxin oxidoreductase gamma subunit
VLVDPHFVHRRNELNSRCIELPMHASILAAQKSSQNLNLCMLGALTGLIDFISTESVAEAVRVRFQPGCSKLHFVNTCDKLDYAYS